jgi:hypothetical protein
VQDYESFGSDAQKSAEIWGTEIGLYGYFDENFGILHKRELLKHSETLYSNSYEKSIANRTFHAAAAVLITCAPLLFLKDCGIILFEDSADNTEGDLICHCSEEFHRRSLWAIWCACLSFL